MLFVQLLLGGVQNGALYALTAAGFALIFGAFWLGEPVHIELVAALGVVIFGITLVNRKSAAAPVAPPEATAEIT